MKQRFLTPVSNLGWLWLVAGLAMVVAPHLLRLPPWLGLFCLGAIAWRLARDLRGWQLPGTGLRLVLTVAGVGSVFAAYGTVIGRDAGVALLAVMLSLKLMEMTTLRDAMMVVVLAYFLVAAGFLFSQSLFAGVYLFGAVVVLTAALIVVNHPSAKAALTRQYLGRAGELLLQALPLMAVLFVLFPRISGMAAWQISTPQLASRTGLSDQLTMGDVDALASSAEVAFRVEFKTTPPEVESWYWRGPVLWHTDGRSWSGLTAEEHRSEGSPPSFESLGAALDYTVTLEPGSGRWLTGMEMPGKVPPQATVTSDLQMMSVQPIVRPLRYEMRSYPRYRLKAITPQARAIALSLPEHGNPRTRELVSRWVEEEALSDAELVKRTLTLFREEPFYYTRHPPILRSDPVDDFLFNTRRGFCEHYAAAFVTLMRAAGVPARIVTGYQGGEFNSVGNYWIVRQSDAHAWAEIYLREEGWVRIDPTSAVAPSRVEVESFNGSGSESAGRIALPWPTRAMRWVGHGWDAVSYQWDRWVAGYSEARQRELLDRLGLKGLGLRGLLFLLLGAAFVAVLLASAWLAWRTGRHSDPAARLYEGLCRRLARAGLPARRPNEGESEFAQRVGALRPELAETMAGITELYQLVRYGARGAGRLGELRQAVRAFRM